MAGVEEPKLKMTTLAERIAALNQQKNFQSPVAEAGKRAAPPPPPRPTRTATEKAPPLPRRTPPATAHHDHDHDHDPDHDHAEVQQNDHSSTLPPPLPTRPSQQHMSPKLPDRRPSNQTLSARRNSAASDVSHVSSISNLSLNQTASSTTTAGSENSGFSRKLPPVFDAAKLPPLPPSRRGLETQASDEQKTVQARIRSSMSHGKSAPVVPRIADAPRPSLPPPLPSRPALPPRRLPPPPSSCHAQSAEDGTPPPVPLASRPTLSRIESAPPVVVVSPPSCLVCRDFSGPDSVAALYPTQALPRQDPVGYLAQMLCSPFPSHTDKARAVFTWCHHNIAYDVQGFFSGCIPRGQTPSETILSGKAVCEGYAKVFEAIARRAGLEVAVVTGHGKGFGFKPVAEGEAPPPPNPTGHAWNAVRIDGGAWKLVDSCWGAGHIDSNKYTKQFAPHHFYLSNEAFGQRHFPSDPRHFYRQDGRIPTWGEYVLGDTRGEPARWFGDATREGLSETNFAPRERRIRVGGGGGAVRFQFAKVCEHWTPEKNGRGKQMLLVLCVKGADGEHGEVHPLDHDGFWFWIDFPARHLGRPGQDVSVMAIDTMGGESGRGLTKEEFCRRKGYQGYSMVAIASWDLV